MASRSGAALKMAAVFMLVLFAGQLLMAAPAAATKCKIDHSRTGLDDCSRCLRRCDLDDFSQPFAECHAEKCSKIPATEEGCTIDHSRTGLDDCSRCLRRCDLDSFSQDFKECFAEKCSKIKAAVAEFQAA